jgi:hypothetical protein
MYFHGGPFWFLMGMLTILVAAGFKAFAEGRGWVLTWWKWLLAGLWYGLLNLTLFAFGTLVGENESSAGVKIGLLGLFICLVFGVGLWRVLGHKSAVVPSTETSALES